MKQQKSCFISLYYLAINSQDEIVCYETALNTLNG